jgi:hypothetical protein
LAGCRSIHCGPQTRCRDGSTDVLGLRTTESDPLIK